jgi:hypothetical protein
MLVRGNESRCKIEDAELSMTGIESFVADVKRRDGWGSRPGSERGSEDIEERAVVIIEGEWI